jgi:perosamine synthetase
MDGQMVRGEPLPYRKLFGESEFMAVKEVFDDCWENEYDFGYQGKFEEAYTSAFCTFQGGGFADAVCSGTAAVYLAVCSLELPKGSEVIISPVTDPGCVSAVILAGMKPIVADSAPNQFNVGPDEFDRAINSKTAAAVLTHTGGVPLEMDRIIEVSQRKNIKMIEDCSQAHGGEYKKKKVGCFGDIAVFSTMFSKTHATGGCGGIIFTKNENLYWRVRAYADRGKSFEQNEFDAKDPSNFLFPTLNFNQNELSCAIGKATLERLPSTIEKRVSIVRMINDELAYSSIVKPIQTVRDARLSPFFHTIVVDLDKISVSKIQFAKAIGAEGIWINPNYNYVVTEWKWFQELNSSNRSKTHNASDFKNSSFNILFNERFEEKDVMDIVKSIKKVESVYMRK